INLRPSNTRGEWPMASAQRGDGKAPTGPATGHERVRDHKDNKSDKKAQSKVESEAKKPASEHKEAKGEARSTSHVPTMPTPLSSSSQQPSGGQRNLRVILEPHRVNTPVQARL